MQSRLCFEELFSNNIKQLLFNYPLDRVTDSGTPFWSGAKKPPSPLLFDCSDALHIDFIRAAAYMRCRMFGLAKPSITDDYAWIVEILNNVEIPVFR